MLLGLLLVLFGGACLLSSSFRDWLFASDFRRDFTATIIATVLDVVLGVPAALEMERYKSDQEKSEQQEHLLAAIDRALVQNMGLLKKLSDDIRPDRIVEATAESRYRILDDLDLNQDIEAIRSDLDIVSKMVTAQFNLAYGIESRTTDGLEMRNQLLEGIKKRITKVQGLIEEARLKISTKLKLAA